MTENKAVNVCVFSQNVLYMLLGRVCELDKGSCFLWHDTTQVQKCPTLQQHEKQPQFRLEVVDDSDYDMRIHAFIHLQKGQNARYQTVKLWTEKARKLSDEIKASLRAQTLTDYQVRYLPKYPKYVQNKLAKAIETQNLTGRQPVDREPDRAKIDWGNE